jgi:TnpA family transposase
MKLLMGFGIDLSVVMNRNFVGLHESGENKTARITHQEENSEKLFT